MDSIKNNKYILFMTVFRTASVGQVKGTVAEICGHQIYTINVIFCLGANANLG